jgi:hypothetical protein
VHYTYDSAVKRDFAQRLDQRDDIKLSAKLPQLSYFVVYLLD